MKSIVRSFLFWLSVISCLGVACAPVASVNAPPKLVLWVVDLPQADRDKVVRVLRDRQFAQLDAQYGGLQQQYERGEINDRELTLQYQAFYETSPDLESILTEWIAQRPTSYPARLARGIYYRKVGEAKRGGKFASETPCENLVALSDYLKLANNDLQDSLKLTPKPIVTLLHLMNSSMYSGDKEGKVLWLNYANRIDAGNYGVRRRYLLALRPRWGGSYEEMWAYLGVCRGQQMSGEYLRIFESNIYLDQAQTFAERGQYDRALPLYRKALSLLDGIDNTERLEALKGVVYSRRNSQNLEDFLPEIEEVLRLDSNERQILGYRGWIRLKQQRIQEGLEDYAKAAELGDPYSQFQRGKQFYYGVPPILSANREQGLVWLKKAADQGEKHAQQFLKQVSQMP